MEELERRRPRLKQSGGSLSPQPGGEPCQIRPPDHLGGRRRPFVIHMAFSTGASARDLPVSATSHYNVAMGDSEPRSVRLSRSVLDRLARRATRYPGMAASTAAAQLIDEGLRMDDHPGVIFRDGPTGRRAVLTDGPDVWEVIRAVRQARSAEHDLADAKTVALVARNTGVSEPSVRTAIQYWAAWPDDVDERIAMVEQAESAHLAEWRRTQRLLTD